MISCNSDKIPWKSRRNSNLKKGLRVGLFEKTDSLVLWGWGKMNCLTWWPVSRDLRSRWEFDLVEVAWTCWNLMDLREWWEPLGICGSLWEPVGTSGNLCVADVWVYLFRSVLHTSYIQSLFDRPRSIVWMPFIIAYDYCKEEQLYRKGSASDLKYDYFYGDLTSPELLPIYSKILFTAALLRIGKKSGHVQNMPALCSFADKCTGTFGW